VLIALSCSRNNTDQSKNSGSTTHKELKGTISISGAFALYPMVTKWAEEFRKIHPDVRIDISAGGAGKGMTDALSGIVDLGMFSREISDVEKAKGVWWISVTKDAVLPTINSNSPVIDQILNRGISKDEFIKLFITREIKTWAELLGKNTNNSNINIYTRSDACGAAQMWGSFLDKDQESLIGIGIYGDPGMADAVKSDINGIGYNNIIYIYDITTREKHPGLEVIPIDLNNNGKIDDNERFYNLLDDIMDAIKNEKYPSPPARELYFVAKEKPDRAEVSEFLKWIITEGQEFVKEGGYVRLTDEKLQRELQKLTSP
jgi:phosphate transport system substrate-binding protein